MKYDTTSTQKDLDQKDQQEVLLEKAKAHYREAEQGWKPIRDKALADQKFYHGNQWDEGIRTLASRSGEPVLEVNRLPTFVKQIENELRQREMAITIAATDEDGSDETANIFSGMIRGIEQRSNAKSHYIHAAGENGALVPGYGFLKVEVDYANANSFDQDIWIKSVKDPMTILPDPMALEADFSDGNFWFEVRDYTEHDFKRAFPGAQANSLEYFGGAMRTEWAQNDMIRVVRYWYKKEQSLYTFLLDDGTVVQEAEVDDFDFDPDDADKRFVWMNSNKEDLSNRKVILRKRKVTSTEIRWADLNGAEILDEGEWAGSMFPFAAVTGPMSIIDGKRDVRGIIRFAQDSQKMLNYMASSAARRIASGTKAPYIVSKEAISGHERMWNASNTENLPYLVYNQVNSNSPGTPNAVPARADQTGQISDLLQAAAKFENDLKATIGIYDAGLGATPNEQSGVAIKTLAQQGQNANFHFSDNLVTSLKHIGEIVVDLIPKVYDTARMVKSVGPEGQARLVKINDLTQEKGKDTVYDIAGAAGHYGVTVNVGPAYATAKQAAVESMLELIRVNPAMAPYVQDIIASNMDFSGKETVSKRLLKLLAIQAPQIIEDPETEEVPPQALAALEQQKQMITQMQQSYQALQDEAQKMQLIITSKQIDHQQAMQKSQIDFEQAAQLANLKSHNDLELQRARAAADAASNERLFEIESIKTQLGHNEKTMQVIIQAMKQFGPYGGEVVAAITPQIDASMDIASATSATTMPMDQTPPESIPMAPQQYSAPMTDEDMQGM